MPPNDSNDSGDIAIRLRGAGKAYTIFDRPHDRLKQMFWRGRKKLYHEFWAVRNLDLDIPRGQTVGIVGRNGSGKSTLLQMICGTLRPTCGEVSVNGRVAALLELGAGFNPDFTGRENVFLNATILGLDPREIRQRYDAIAAFADIGEFIDQPVKTYSSGMYARLAFAVAANINPDILVVDEALSVGDEAFQRKCFGRMEQIRRDGATILFVSHSASTILDLCHRAILFDHGECLLDDGPKVVVDAYQKLIYAAPERVAIIRDAIRARHRPEDAADAADPAASTDPADPAVPEAAAGRSGPAIDADTVAYFDPDLKTRSLIDYPSNGATIRSPILLTADQRPVNCLASGRRYLLKYAVRFQEAVGDVRFHTLIKTIPGQELGGGGFPARNQSGLTFQAGETVEMVFPFHAHLNPGVFVLNCGVTGSDGRVLHRLVDALLFRVLDGNGHAYGPVNFGYAPALFRASETAGPPASRHLKQGADAEPE